MNEAERAIAEILSFRRLWGDQWALDRIQQAANEMAQRAEREQRAQIYRNARARVIPKIRTDCP